MRFKKAAWITLHCCFFLVSCLQLIGADDTSINGGFVKLLKTPHAVTNLNSATFAFQVFLFGNTCDNCTTLCKLDDQIPSGCKDGKVSYTTLQDGNHTFEVCIDKSLGFSCATYNWTIDTVPPSAYVTASTTFTNASTVPVYVTFSEPCTGGGGFRCSSADACNLLVYGPGQIIPNTLSIIQPDLKFSLLVSLSSSDQYGRVVLVMDRSFCTDIAGNRFTRTENSSLFVRFDRRPVIVDLRTHIPERLLQLDRETRTVLATNKNRNLKIYLYFTEPVMNSSSEVLNSLSTNQGSLLPIIGDTIGNRRFGFQVINISSTMSVVTVSLDSSLIISRQWTPVSPIAPVTFLYDSQRPSVRLSTTSHMRTRESSITVMIKFLKPVFGFNSSHVSITGGLLQSFHEISWSLYAVAVQADNRVISVSIPENITSDVSGNKNEASNILQVKHYSIPTLSMVVSSTATGVFVVTSLVSGLLTVSTASLRSVGAFPRPTSYLNSDPARNLFRIVSHIQVFALSRWLAVSLPVEYYEFARGLQWSIPYLTLPWETGHTESVMVGSTSPTNSKGSIIFGSGIFKQVKPLEENVATAARVASLYGLPLTPMEYRSFFESQNVIPEAPYIKDPQNSHGWRDFYRSMFWLGVIGGSLILLHCLLVLIFSFKKKNSEKRGSFGALIFPRFEIFLLILALPCVCEASASLIKGGATSGIIVGILLVGAVAFVVFALFLFLSIGITFGKLLQYKEVHHEGQEFHWYQELIRVTLGPGKKGQWIWKNKPNSRYLTMIGPLFEDLRGPPKYMVSQIAGGRSSIKHHGDSIIPSDDETEDAEAPVIQKLFGILRIYYTFFESMRRVCLGILAGAYSSNWSSRTPTIILLSITSFQLFFMVLKKPFIRKRVQLVEIVSVSCELGIFASCLVLVNQEFSGKTETRIGFGMVLLFVVAFIAQMINIWHALYQQIQKMDTTKNSFLTGLRKASLGLLLIFVPRKCFKNLVIAGSENVETASSAGDRNQSSGSRSSGDRTWLRQLRQLAQASFSKEGSGTINDPSTSTGTRWSGLWSNKRSGSSSDSKSKPKSLYKDLEAIFASK